jgi:hypothetical protein
MVRLLCYCGQFALTNFSHSLRPPWSKSPAPIRSSAGC